ncbi:MAG: polysaccharide biosynthesis C-terminal domain-containing protein, partial [Planctomycetota bacterium]
IVHFSHLSPDDALQMVGNYHSSYLVPALLVSFSDLLSGLILPHLSHDWEVGRREEAARRLNMTIRLSVLGMIAFGACLLGFGPLLFDVVLQGRYNDGLAVLPWTLAACVWYGAHLLSQNYLWCAEKSRLAIAPLALGLVVNIGLNVLLLPTFGLYGAVLATATGTCLCVLATLGTNRLQGMAIDKGTWLMALAPIALGLGFWPAVVALTALAATTLATDLIVTSSDRCELKDMALDLASRKLGRGPLGRANHHGTTATS